MKKYGGIVLFAAVFLIAAMGIYTGHAKAAEKNITIYNGSNDANDWEDGDIYHVGDYGKIELQMDWYSMVEIARKEFHSSNEKTATVDAAGNFRIVGGGKTFITAKGWDAAGNECFSASYELFAAGDMSKTRLQTTTVKMYQAGWSYDDEGLQVRIPLVDAPDLTYYAMSYRVADSSMWLTCQLDSTKKELIIQGNYTGKTTLTVDLNGKIFTITVQIIEVNMSKNSAVLCKKNTVQLKVKGYKGKLSWGTTNKKVVSVSKSGKVKAKKNGNAVAYAKIGTQKVGCAVSVVTKKRRAVINKAKKIARTCKYSQAKRMSDKHYDCSSLVWKAYQKEGKSFGNKNYAPVAADIAKWCASHKRWVKGGDSYKNISKMKLRPGDLLFGTGANNGRYKGIYHVEMFVGYACYGFEGNKPILTTKWAARGDGYGGSEWVGRP